MNKLKHFLMTSPEPKVAIVEKDQLNQRFSTTFKMSRTTED